MDFLQRVDHVTAHTVDVGNIGILANVKSLIDAAAQMLGKMTVNVLADLRAGDAGIQNDLCHDGSSF